MIDQDIDRDYDTIIIAGGSTDVGIASTQKLAQSSSAKAFGAGFIQIGRFAHAHQQDAAQRNDIRNIQRGASRLPA